MYNNLIKEERPLLKEKEYYQKKEGILSLKRRDILFSFIKKEVNKALNLFT